MKKTVLITCTAIAGVMFVLPWLIVRLIQSEPEPSIALLLIFCNVLLLIFLNPICSMFTGLMAGKYLRKLWWIPPVNAAAFLTGTWICYEPGETEFLLTAVYFVLGTAAMFVSAWIYK